MDSQMGSNIPSIRITGRVIPRNKSQYNVEEQIHHHIINSSKQREETITVVMLIVQIFSQVNMEYQKDVKRQKIKKFQDINDKIKNRQTRVSTDFWILDSIANRSRFQGQTINV